MPDTFKQDQTIYRMLLFPSNPTQCRVPLTLTVKLFPFFLFIVFFIKTNKENMKRIYGREYEEKICKRMNSNYVTKYE